MNELVDELISDFSDKEYAHAYVDEFLNMSIATQIKTLRGQRGLRQEELATLTGMKQERISVLENVNYDRWSLKTLKKLAEAFDVALKVSFEAFTSRITDIDEFSRESLERLGREEDLALQRSVSRIVGSDEETINVDSEIAYTERYCRFEPLGLNSNIRSTFSEVANA